MNETYNMIELNMFEASIHTFLVSCKFSRKLKIFLMFLTISSITYWKQSFGSGLINDRIRILAFLKNRIRPKYSDPTEIPGFKSETFAKL